MADKERVGISPVGVGRASRCGVMGIHEGLIMARRLQIRFFEVRMFDASRPDGQTAAVSSLASNLEVGSRCQRLQKVGLQECRRPTNYVIKKY